MAAVENPLRCLALRVQPDRAGLIDLVEVASYLDEIAGERQWMTAEQWLFIDPPAEAEGETTLPVVMPVGAATRAVLNDLTGEPPRIITDYQMSPAETRRWRWYASLSHPADLPKSLFPWERSALA
ncbi:hypothetical protein [Brevundimonas sp. Bb-A]|uniref:hypothetical protein n=1 Tax=Brevundimonas sp. Bb-A TaxID=2560058 RepID=UPI0012A9274D|nr:hypothetical protein [Brevundimonas sp. Bb-A]QFU30122.1 hypothetical protein BSP_00455 [Brevundimonas sp. Bb-A]